MEDEDITRPRNSVPKKASHIIKLADGSEDDDGDMPGLVPDNNDDDDDEDDSDKEAPAESAEAELSKFQMNTCRKLS